MSGRESFDQAFDAALDALRRGATLPDVLAAHPDHRDELLPMLRLAAGAAASAIPAPSPRLARNFRFVDAALNGAREEARRPSPWWRRPVTFASLSLPAGIFALAAIGAAGAAAGGAVAVSQTHVPAAIEHVVTLGMAGGGSGPNDNAVTPGGPGGGAPGAPTEGHGNNGGGSASEGTPENANAPVTMTISGTVQDVSGNSFTLRAANGDWHVNTDANTVISGVIADGATAAVAGTQTAQKNLHATTITITQAAPVGVPTQPNPPANGRPATSTPAPATPTPPAELPTATPRGNGNGGDNGTPPKTPASGNGTPPKTPASGNGDAGANAPPGNGTNGASINGNGGGHSQTP